MPMGLPITTSKDERYAACRVRCAVLGHGMPPPLRCHLVDTVQAGLLLPRHIVHYNVRD
jgi:hypothetical protein